MSGSDRHPKATPTRGPGRAGRISGLVVLAPVNSTCVESRRRATQESRMRAMVLKEFRQLRRDRRTLALMIMVPLLLLIVFGYVARFDIKQIPTAVVGAQAEMVAGLLPEPFDVRIVDSAGDRATGEGLLRRSPAIIAVRGGPPRTLLVAGTRQFGPPAAGTVITSLGVVRERQEGTLEQLAVMPLRPRDVIIGKIAPYFLVGVLDMAVITAAGLLLFDVPFRGSWLA